MKICLFILATIFPATVIAQYHSKVVIPIDTPMIVAKFNNTVPVIKLASLEADYYTKHFGFFCKQELKMQQQHIPLTFRLGSMDYCNWLEQKPGYKFFNK